MADKREAALRRLRSALAARGWNYLNLPQRDPRAAGWRPGTIRNAIHRYFHTGRIPKEGTIAAEILHRLEELSEQEKKKPPRAAGPEGA